MAFSNTLNCLRFLIKPQLSGRKTKETKMLSARKINKFTLQIIFKSKKSFYLSFNNETALAEYKYGFTEITQLEFDTLKALVEKEQNQEPMQDQIIYTNKCVSTPIKTEVKTKTEEKYELHLTVDGYKLISGKNSISVTQRTLIQILGIKKALQIQNSHYSKRELTSDIASLILAQARKVG